MDFVLSGAEAWPSAQGPRKSGQSATAGTVGKTNKNNANEQIERMRRLPDTGIRNSMHANSYSAEFLVTTSIWPGDHPVILVINYHPF